MSEVARVKAGTNSGVVYMVSALEEKRAYCTHACDRVGIDNLKDQGYREVSSEEYDAFIKGWQDEKVSGTHQD